MQREYTTKRAMQRGIQHEANHGWRVISTMDVPPGCLRKLLFGLIFARTHYLVTYEK